MSDQSDQLTRATPRDPTEYERVQATPEFAELRSRFRRFVFPCTIFFLIWYFLYVLMVTFLPGPMSVKVIGNINVGLIFGILQFVSTFGITMAYVRWADRKFDPLAEQIKQRAEGAGL